MTFLLKLSNMAKIVISYMLISCVYRTCLRLDLISLRLSSTCSMPVSSLLLAVADFRRLGVGLALVLAACSK